MVELRADPSLARYEDRVLELMDATRILPVSYEDLERRVTFMHANDERPGFYVQPPWIEYPESDPTWGGWRQGESENWFCNVWLPFWERLKPEERILYLKNWTPPKYWNLYLTQH